MDMYAQMRLEQAASYEQYKDFSGYDLSEDDYYEHDRNGNRRNFEIKYFAKRSCMVARALNVHLNHKEADADLIRIIDSICNEFTWILPAHRKNNPHIDLYSAITAQALCEIAHYISLPEELHAKIHSLAQKRIKEIYETKVLNWESKRNNWQAVCAGSIGMVYLYEFPESFADVKDRILKSLHTYIDYFGDDGICTEGIGYWGFGFGYFLYFAEMLRRMEGTDLFQNSKVQKIAQFQQNMFLKNNITVSFSDTPSRRISYNIGLTHFLRKEYREDIKVPPAQYRYPVGGEHDWASAFRTFLWFDESIESDSFFYEAQSGEEYFSSSKWYINRKRKFAFVAKGGHNQEFHNHNDLGSFIITDGTEQLAADYGAGEYTKGYFTLEERYNYLCCSSAGHSVPIIDGKYQQVGAEHRSEVKKAKDNEFIVEISKAYDVEELSELERKFKITDDGVILTDSFVFHDNKNHVVTERIVSLVQPQLLNGSVVIGSMIVDAECVPEITAEAVTGHLGEKDTLYIVDFELNGNIFVCKFLFK